MYAYNLLGVYLFSDVQVLNVQHDEVGFLFYVEFYSHLTYLCGCVDGGCGVEDMVRREQRVRWNVYIIYIYMKALKKKRLQPVEI